METYGMAAPDDDNTIDCYQQYVAQTGYRCERPEDGDHMRAEYQNSAQHWYQPRSSGYQDDPAPYAGAGAGLRSGRGQRRTNPRNGLYSQMEGRRDAGDYYNSLPGLGNYERPSGQYARRSHWF